MKKSNRKNNNKNKNKKTKKKKRKIMSIELKKERNYRKT